MGFNQSWLAVKTERIEQALELLELRKTGETSGCAENGWNCIDMKNGWMLVISEHCCFQPLHLRQEVLIALSKDSEVITAFLEEHVMYAYCAEWRNGIQVWKIEHNAQQDINHLLVEGKLPTRFEFIKRTQLQMQEGVTDIDHVFEIPLAVGKSICGYKHDETLEGLGEEPFEMLECLTPSPKKETLSDKIRSFFSSKHSNS